MHYSVLVTSCDRFDLLRRTLESFIAVQCGGLKPRECIIVDDSAQPMPEWLAENIHYYSANLGTVRWVSNGARRGQIYSADRLWSLCANDFAFWMEDDWLFHGTHFMQESAAILDKYPDVVTVSLRGDTGWHRLIDLPAYEGFKVTMPGWRGGWGGWTFNCGLRRKADYLALGSYSKHVSYGSNLGNEKELSVKLLKEGRIIADLGRPIVEHIGGQRSRATEPLPPLPKVLIAIPVCHTKQYGKWEGVKGDTDIYHVNGQDDRVAALRDTWLKDVAQFPNVEYKLFYGGSGGREPLADEVFLPVRDDYGSLPAKTIAICKWAKEQGFDLIFKCDDDTGVYVDRILQESMSGLWDYAGYLHGRVCTGGTGYWLSRRAFEIIADRATSTYHWAEDVTVSHFLFHHNIQGHHLAGHRTGREDHWFWRDGHDPAVDMCEVSAFHAVRPEDMRKWYAAK